VKVYLVGGAVRDQLLGLPVHEKDWVVVGASEQAMLDAGFSRADSVFPVFIHPETGDEYALARTEVKSGPGYKGFDIYAGPDVTLEQDLLRRDLTINALAMDEAGGLVDVCGGREDLDAGLLRHITPAFEEDPVRLLRTARFAAKLGKWGFRVAHGTHGLMRKMAAADDLLNLKPERIWKEMSKALAEPQPWRFFEVLHRCGALRRLIPELARTMGEPGGHGSKANMDAMAALKAAAVLTEEPAIRFAVAIYPAARSESDPQAFLRRLRAGRDAVEGVMDLLALTPWPGDPDAATLLAMLERLKPQRHAARYQGFLHACRALWPQAAEVLLPRLDLALEVSRCIDVKSLQVAGLSGADLGTALRQQRRQRLAERLAAIPRNG
jgi:tRNA nucleotidyltransferase (CCA-adding enzyme)